MPSTTVKLPAGSGSGGVLAAGVSGTVVYPGQDAVSHDELAQQLSGYVPRLAAAPDPTAIPTYVDTSVTPNVVKTWNGTAWTLVGGAAVDLLGSRGTIAASQTALASKGGAFAAFGDMLDSMVDGYEGAVLACLHVVGPSTANDNSVQTGAVTPMAYPHLMALALAAAHPEATVLFKAWDNTTCAPAARQQIQLGTGNGGGRVYYPSGIHYGEYLSYPSTFPDGSSRIVNGDHLCGVEISCDPTGVRGARVMTLMAVYGPTNAIGDNVEWLNLNGDDTLLYKWVDVNGAQHSATSTAPLPIVSGQPIVVVAAMDVDNGLGGYTITFYYSTTGADGLFTQLGTPISTTTGGPTSITQTNPRELVLGAQNPNPPIAGSGGVSPAVEFVGNFHEVLYCTGTDPNSQRRVYTFPPMLQSWIRQPYGAGELLHGAPVIIILGYGWGGHSIFDFETESHNWDGYWTGSDNAAATGQDNHGMMTPDFGQTVVLLAPTHNEGTRYSEDYIRVLEAWWAKTRNRLPNVALAVMAENTKITPALDAPGGARRSGLVVAWGARQGATCIDLRSLFRAQSNWSYTQPSALINADGTHPDQAGQNLILALLDYLIAGRY